MSTRAAGIIVAVLAFTAAGTMLNQSGMAGVMGNQCSTTELGDAVGGIEVPGTGDGEDSLAVTAIIGFTDFLVFLGPFERALWCLYLPEWFTWPAMNLVIRPLYAFAGLQLARGVILE